MRAPRRAPSADALHSDDEYTEVHEIAPVVPARIVSAPPRRDEVKLPAIPRSSEASKRPPAAAAQVRHASEHKDDHAGARSTSASRKPRSRSGTRSSMVDATAVYGAVVNPRRKSVSKQHHDGDGIPRSGRRGSGHHDGVFSTPRLQPDAVLVHSTVKHSAPPQSPDGAWHVHAAPNLRMDMLGFLHAPAVATSLVPPDDHDTFADVRVTNSGDILHRKLPSLVTQAAVLSDDDGGDLERDEPAVKSTKSSGSKGQANQRSPIHSAPPSHPQSPRGLMRHGSNVSNSSRNSAGTPSSYGQHKTNVRSAAVASGSKLPMPRQFVQSARNLLDLAPHADTDGLLQGGSGGLGELSVSFASLAVCLRDLRHF